MDRADLMPGSEIVHVVIVGECTYEVILTSRNTLMIYASSKDGTYNGKSLPKIPRPQQDWPRWTKIDLPAAVTDYIEQVKLGKDSFFGRD